MRKITILLLACTSVLFLGSMAQAKGLEEAQVCGSEDCTTITDMGDMMAFVDLAGPMDPPTAEAFYTIEMKEAYQGGESWTMDYVPGADAVRMKNEYGDWVWYRMQHILSLKSQSKLDGTTPYPSEAFSALIEVAPGSFDRADLADATVKTQASGNAGLIDAASVESGTRSVAPLIVVGLAALTFLAGGALLLRRRRFDQVTG
jgi:hypothetical protein